MNTLGMAYMNFRKPWMFLVIFLMVSIFILVAIYTDVERLFFEAEKTKEERVKEFNVNFTAMKNGHLAYNVGDYRTALNDWLPLAEKGNYLASERIGDIYYCCDHDLQNYAKAFNFYRLAAEQGNRRAFLLIGYMYTDGTGVVQDNVRAHMWYNIASANSAKGSWAERNAIEKRMSPEAIEKAQSMAAECMRSGYENCGW